MMIHDPYLDEIEDFFQMLGDADRLDAQIFVVIHQNHVWLHDEPSIAAWVGKLGVEVAKFTAAFRSFGVNTSAGQAEQKGIDHQIPGTPTLAVAGKYTLSGDQEKMLTTADQLITMERA
jgi:thiol:disulfide interchange protein DsbA